MRAWRGSWRALAAGARPGGARARRRTAASTAVKREAWRGGRAWPRRPRSSSTTGASRTSIAASARDAFFLQGYNAARDRLWQIDLWRKRGLGRLAASFGPAYVAQDRAARLFLYRGDMAAEWAAYGPGAREAVEAFAAGVNAYVAEVQRRQAAAAGRVQAHRQPAGDLGRRRTSCASAATRWSPTSPPRSPAPRWPAPAASRPTRCAASWSRPHTPAVPEGLDPCVVPADVLKDYCSATEPVSFEAAGRGGQQAEAAPQVQLAAGDRRAYQTEGSNNWVIAPSRTATGRPILANDPHRPVGVPSLRYIVHLNAPGLDIIGAGEPALPGVSLGHNADDRLRPHHLLHRSGGPLRLRDQRERRLPLQGRLGADEGGPRDHRGEGRGAARRSTLKFTRHGPVVAEDDAKGHAFAMRTVWNQPGALRLLRLLAAVAREVLGRLQGRRSDAWGAPPLNLVYRRHQPATSAGRPPACTPVRPNWDGLMPVPGRRPLRVGGLDAAKASCRPSHNPPQGFFATANAMNLPAGLSGRAATSATSGPTARAITRIEEVLARHAQGDAGRLHGPADRQPRRAVAPGHRAAGRLSSPDPTSQQALDLLKAWDNDETDRQRRGGDLPGLGDQPPGPHGRRRRDAGGRPHAGRLRPARRRRSPSWKAPQAAAARDALLLASLAAAVTELKNRLGPDMATWTWGRLHHARFEPAAAVLADRQLAAQMAHRARCRVPGSAQSPRAATYRPLDFRQTAGASVRLVMDVGAWDNSVADQHARPVRRPLQPPLPRPLPAVGGRRLRPAGLQPRGRGPRRRAGGDADARRDEHVLRVAAVGHWLSAPSPFRSVAIAAPDVPTASPAPRAEAGQGGRQPAPT